MTPVVQLYWLRVALGIIAAVITAVLAMFVFGSATDFTPLLNCISVALIIYFISYYAVKPFYKNKIEKQSKILSTGIGMYFFTWIAFFVLFYTVLRSAIPA